MSRSTCLAQFRIFVRSCVRVLVRPLVKAWQVGRVRGTISRRVCAAHDDRFGRGRGRMTATRTRTLPVVPVAPLAPIADVGEACALQTPVAIDEDARIDLSEALDRAKLPPGRGRLAVVAMSGGVDSGVTALLMKEAGYRTIGINMRLFTPNEGHSRCCSIDDMEDARAVCQKLGIPFYPLNMEREFVGSVIEPFVDAYLAGRTPNPCLECNRKPKFGFLLGRAKAL